MDLTITHRTSYRYETPVPYGLLQLRLEPSSGPGQSVENWQNSLEGGRRETAFMDQFQNKVELVSLDAGSKIVTITSQGKVATTDNSGVLGPHRGYVPLWLFRRETPLTKPGPMIEKLAGRFLGSDEDKIALLHGLSAAVLDSVKYEVGTTDVSTNAEDALVAGHGVCQDHTHVFLSAARLLGFPARYVGGHLYSEDQVEQDAGHAWAEAHVDGLGWVGFDIANGISPDDRYVRVATGLDYVDAAPVTGVRHGNGAENLQVVLQVQQ